MEPFNPWPKKQKNHPEKISCIFLIFFIFWEGW